MYDLTYWRSHEDILATLDEPDRIEILTELSAEDVRNRERESYDLLMLDNKQKLGLLKRWYPRAYRTVETFYPGFIQEPDGYPPVIARAINALIGSNILSTDREIAFT